MKRFTKNISSMIVALMLVSHVAAIDEGKNTTHISKADIGGGLTFIRRDDSYENTKQKAYIFELTPNEGTLPVISSGKIYGRDRLDELVTDDTLAAVNGDFYSLRTGVPMGVMINGGLLVSSDDDPENPRAAIGFRADGSTVIGIPRIKLSLTDMKSGNSLDIEHFNKYPSIWGAYLSDSEFGDSTASTDMSTEYVIRPDNKLSVGSEISGVIEEIRTQVTNGAIPEDCLVLTVADEGTAKDRFTELSVGDEIKISVSADEGWENVITAIGGGDIILENGVMPDGIIDEDHEKYANPRTAIGVTTDSKVIIYAADGRSSTSKGLTETALSAMMAELGCVDAINLDGGGSTSVMVRDSHSGEIAYINSPSDGKPRTIGNALLLVPEYESDGIPYALATPELCETLLRNSSLEITAWKVDRAFRMAGEVDGLELITGDAGSSDGNIFTAGNVSGLFTLGLASDGLFGRAYLNIIDKLDSLELYPLYSRALEDSDAKLNYDAVYNGRTVISDNASFYFTLNGTHIIPDRELYPDAMLICELGYLTDDLRFVAFDGAVGEVEVGIWFDEHVSFVKIRTGSGDEEIPLDTLNYDSGSFYSDKLMAIGAKSISLWVDRLTDDPYCVLTDENGNEHKLSYKLTKDYSRQTGYYELTATIPEKLSSQLKITTLLHSGSELTIKDAAISYGDEKSPAIAGLDGHFAKEQILSLYDMTVIRASDCENVDGKLYYDPARRLTRGEFAKLLSLWLGLDTAGGELTLEPDTPEDKLPYINAVISAGLMNGSGVENGVTIFRANDTITREEVCKVLGQLIDADISEIGFSDSDMISKWAVEGVSRCVSAGIIKGYDDNTFHPERPVTRGEIAVMLTRAENSLDLH